MNDTRTLWSADQDEFLLANVGKMSWQDIAVQVGFPAKVVKRRHRTLVEKLLKKTDSKGVSETQFRSEGPEGQVFTCVSNTVRTVDDALRVSEVDLNVWEVKNYEINKWDMGARTGTRNTGTRKRPHWVKDISVVELWQVKIWLKRRDGVNERALADEIVDKMRVHAPMYLPMNYAAPRSVTDARFLLEVSPFDLHIGKRAWKLETGRDDYDEKIARDRVVLAVEEILDYVRHRRIEQIVLPLGNDLMQVDNRLGTTTKGTHVDTSIQWRQAYHQSMDLMVWMVDRLRRVAPVKVVVIPGNHDNNSAFTLGYAIDAWYSRCGDVSVDKSPVDRKYLEYGVNLIGWLHGDEIKLANLPLLMAQDQPDAWARTKDGTREWHIGHYHIRRQVKYTAGDTIQGVGVRVLPSLCSADAWHALKGYLGEVRAMEAYLWSYDRGYGGHFSSNIPVSRQHETHPYTSLSVF
jgi:hypothetical protein